MIKSLPYACLLGATLIAGTAALTTADAQMTKKTPAATANGTMMKSSKTTTATMTKPMTTATPMAKSTMAKSTMTSKTMTKSATMAPKGRMVSAKLANGKTVTYNCSLAGNAKKQACK